MSVKCEISRNFLNFIKIYPNAHLETFSTDKNDFRKAQKGENCVLGLATGSTPTTVYGELVRMHQEEGLSFKNLPLRSNQGWPSGDTKHDGFAQNNRKIRKKLISTTTFCINIYFVVPFWREGGVI